MSESTFELFSNDFHAAAAAADSVLVGCEPLNSVVFYAGAKTLTILNDEHIPSFLPWFSEQIATGEWYFAEDSVTTAGKWYDKSKAGVLR